MGDIGFEEQLELERLEKEKIEKEGEHPKEKVDPDGTVYEWDAQKKAWFPKVDANFIAQYQMNYGVPSGSGEGSTDEQKQAEYYNYYQNYYAAQVQQEKILNKKKTVQREDTAEEVVGKLEDLENNLQNQTEEYKQDSKEDMEKYTEEEKQSYNDYWNYYYQTEQHDYYSDCIAQFDQQTAGEADGKEEEKKEDGKKKKKRKPPVQEKREEGWFDIEEKDNTNVYVSGLPSDITMEEFKEIMTKYGMVMHDPRAKQPKMKLYYNQDGQPKGDGRCCYIKKESVDLALSLLDGSDLRGSTVKVELAQFAMKGEFDPTKKKKKLSNKEKKRLKERQEKLFDWRPERPRGARLKHEKIVILKNIFDPVEFEDDPTKINTLSAEMRTECTKYGEVKKVIVYDRHLDGVVCVHFKEPEEADLCVQSLHQRWFAKRRVLAETWDGKTKYEVLETEQEREARLKKWERYLETGEKDSDPKSESAGSSPTSSSASASKATNSSSVSTDISGSSNTNSRTDGAISDDSASANNETSVVTSVNGSNKETDVPSSEGSSADQPSTDDDKNDGENEMETEELNR